MSGSKNAKFEKIDLSIGSSNTFSSTSNQPGRYVAPSSHNRDYADTLKQRFGDDSDRSSAYQPKYSSSRSDEPRMGRSAFGSSGERFEGGSGFGGPRRERTDRPEEPKLGREIFGTQRTEIPERSFDRPERSFDRSDRPERSFDRSDRSDRFNRSEDRPDEPRLGREIFGSAAGSIPPRSFPEKSSERRAPFERSDRSERSERSERFGDRFGDNDSSTSTFSRSDFGSNKTAVPAARERSNVPRSNKDDGFTVVGEKKPVRGAAASRNDSKGSKVQPVSNSKFAILDEDNDAESTAQETEHDAEAAAAEAAAAAKKAEEDRIAAEKAEAARVAAEKAEAARVAAEQAEAARIAAEEEAARIAAEEAEALAKRKAAMPDIPENKRGVLFQALFEDDAQRSVSFGQLKKSIADFLPLHPATKKAFPAVVGASILENSFNIRFAIDNFVKLLGDTSERIAKKNGDASPQDVRKAAVADAKFIVASGLACIAETSGQQALRQLMDDEKDADLLKDLAPEGESANGAWLTNVGLAFLNSDDAAETDPLKKIFQSSSNGAIVAAVDAVGSTDVQAVSAGLVAAAILSGAQKAGEIFLSKLAGVSQNDEQKAKLIQAFCEHWSQHSTDRDLAKDIASMLVEKNLISFPNLAAWRDSTDNISKDKTEALLAIGYWINTNAPAEVKVTQQYEDDNEEEGDE